MTWHAAILLVKHAAHHVHTFICSCLSLHPYLLSFLPHYSSPALSSLTNAQGAENHAWWSRPEAAGAPGHRRPRAGPTHSRHHHRLLRALRSSRRRDSASRSALPLPNPLTAEPRVPAAQSLSPSGCQLAAHQWPRSLLRSSATPSASSRSPSTAADRADAATSKPLPASLSGYGRAGGA